MRVGGSSGEKKEIKLKHNEHRVGLGGMPAAARQAWHTLNPKP